MGESKRKRLQAADGQKTGGTRTAARRSMKVARGKSKASKASKTSKAGQKAAYTPPLVSLLPLISRLPRPFQSSGLEPLKQSDLPPIRQTGSWALVNPSVTLWFRNYNTCIVVLILPTLLILLGSLLAPDLTKINNKTLSGVLIATIGFGWLLLNVPVSYYLQLKAIHGERPGVRECYSRGLSYIFRLIGLGAMMTLFVTAGLLLFIIPGIILIRRYILAPFYLMDQDLGIREAMRRSAVDSKPVSMYIWGVLGVSIAIILGSTTLFTQIFPPLGSIIGAFVTSLYVFAPALRYKEVALRENAIESSIDTPASDVSDEG